MFCDKCKYKAFSGNSSVCGYFLHGGETIYIDSKVKLWCPQNYGEAKTVSTITDMALRSGGARSKLTLTP